MSKKDQEESGVLEVRYQESYAESAKGLKPFAWAVGLSSALIAFSILYVIHLFTTGLHQARLYEQMIAETSGKTPIKEKLKLPAMSKLLPLDDSRVQRVADLIYLVEENQLDKAMQRLQSPMFPHLETNDEFEEALGQLVEKTKSAPVASGDQPVVVVNSDGDAANDQQAPETGELTEDQLREELWGYGNAMLREIATPTVSPAVRKAYTTVIQHTKAKGFNFPPLPGSSSPESETLL